MPDKDRLAILLFQPVSWRAAGWSLRARSSLLPSMNSMPAMNCEHEFLLPAVRWSQSRRRYSVSGLRPEWRCLASVCFLC